MNLDELRAELEVYMSMIAYYNANHKNVNNSTAYLMQFFQELK